MENNWLSFLRSTMGVRHGCLKCLKKSCFAFCFCFSEVLLDFCSLRQLCLIFVSASVVGSFWLVLGVFGSQQVGVQFCCVPNKGCYADYSVEVTFVGVGLLVLASAVF